MAHCSAITVTLNRQGPRVGGEGESVCLSKAENVIKLLDKQREGRHEEWLAVLNEK